MPIPDTNNRLTIEKLIELIDAVENPTRLLTSDGLIPLQVPFEDMTPEQQHACARLEERVGVKMRDIRDYVNSRKPHGAASPDWRALCQELLDVIGSLVGGVKCGHYEQHDMWKCREIFNRVHAIMAATSEADSVPKAPPAKL